MSTSSVSAACERVRLTTGDTHSATYREDQLTCALAQWQENLQRLIDEQVRTIKSTTLLPKTTSTTTVATASLGVRTKAGVPTDAVVLETGDWGLVPSCAERKVTLETCAAEALKAMQLDEQLMAVPVAPLQFVDDEGRVRRTVPRLYLQPPLPPSSETRMLGKSAPGAEQKKKQPPKTSIRPLTGSEWPHLGREGQRTERWYTEMSMPSPSAPPMPPPPAYVPSSQAPPPPPPQSPQYVAGHGPPPPEYDDDPMYISSGGGGWTSDDSWSDGRGDRGGGGELVYASRATDMPQMPLDVGELVQRGGPQPQQWSPRPEQLDPSNPEWLDRERVRGIVNAVHRTGQFKPPFAFMATVPISHEQYVQRLYRHQTSTATTTSTTPVATPTAATGSALVPTSQVSAADQAQPGTWMWPASFQPGIRTKPSDMTDAEWSAFQRDEAVRLMAPAPPPPPTPGTIAVTPSK